jgi:hypothetical protein
MGVSLSREQVHELAPDAASVKAANGLLSDGKWQLLGVDRQALWGECKGSGAKPYQTQVDLSEMVSRCSCPSRKFPCKHSLALMLLYAQGNPRFADADARPAWVEEWLVARHERAIRKETTAKHAATDPQAAAAAADKRAEKRWARISAGVADLQRWLGDCFQRGIANLGPAQTGEWTTMVSRTVDAQAPGLGRYIRHASKALESGSEGYEEAIEHLGLLQLLIAAVNRRNQLSPARIMDLRTALGWSIEKDEILNSPDGDSVSDTWRVIGQISDFVDDRLVERRVWLYGGDSGRFALILDFAIEGRGWERLWMTGQSYRATLRFYPGSVPLRALAEEAEMVVDTNWPAFDSGAAVDRASRWFALNPWLSTLPMTLAPAWPQPTDTGWQLRIEEGAFPLKISDSAGWSMMAQSGAHPLCVAGEWDGRRLTPMLMAEHRDDDFPAWQIVSRGDAA